MTWDYIIVGGGSAGCVLANRLSADAAHKVLLLEAGVGFLDRTPFINAPAGTLPVYDTRLFDWGYRTQPDPTRADRTERLYSGKLLGGGSSINGTMFIRGGAHDYDEWAQLGNEGWSYREVLPFFKRIERTCIGLDEYHGRSGPLGVDYAEPMLDISHRFIEAATEAGIPYNSDINGSRLEGVSRTPCSVYGGLRQSTARTYLRPAMRRRNLQVQTRATARRVLFEGNEAIAVEYEISGRSFIARARKEIILSAGAVRSPHLLLLSGIGPAEQLTHFGIPVVHELRGVGRNYMDHAAAHMVYEVKLPTWCREVSLAKQAYHGLQWLMRRKGMACSGVSQAVAFTRTEDQLTVPDVQITLLPIVLGQNDARAEMIKVYVDECKPVSRGHLELASARASDMPLVYPNFLGGDRSIETFIRGIEIVREVMAAGAIRPYVIREVFPGIQAADKAALERWIRTSAVSMAHPSGTCKMGRDELSVVDEKLRVRGVGRLRVADASIMPALPSGNINAPAIMIGEKAAASILESR